MIYVLCFLAGYVLRGLLAVAYERTRVVVRRSPTHLPEEGIY